MCLRWTWYMCTYTKSHVQLISLTAKMVIDIRGYYSCTASTVADGESHVSLSLSARVHTLKEAMSCVLSRRVRPSREVGSRDHFAPTTIPSNKMLHGSELTKRTALWTLPQLQFQLQAQLCQVLALQADLLIVLMLSILHSIKQHMLNVRFQLQLLQPTTKVSHLMFGGLFSHMRQSWTTKPPIHHHPFQIVVEAKLNTRQIILAAFSVHGQYYFVKLIY